MAVDVRLLFGGGLAYSGGGGGASGGGGGGGCSGTGWRFVREGRRVQVTHHPTTHPAPSLHPSLSFPHPQSCCSGPSSDTKPSDGCCDGAPCEAPPASSSSGGGCCGGAPCDAPSAEPPASSGGGCCGGAPCGPAPDLSPEAIKSAVQRVYAGVAERASATPGIASGCCGGNACAPPAVGAVILGYSTEEAKEGSEGGFDLGYVVGC